MMNQFRVRYMPGGMSLNHSAWWLMEVALIQGMMVEQPRARLRTADYS